MGATTESISARALEAAVIALVAPRSGALVVPRCLGAARARERIGDAHCRVDFSVAHQRDEAKRIGKRGKRHPGSHQDFVHPTIGTRRVAGRAPHEAFARRDGPRRVRGLRPRPLALPTGCIERHFAQQRGAQRVVDARIVERLRVHRLSQQEAHLIECAPAMRRIEPERHIPRGRRVAGEVGQAEAGELHPRSQRMRREAAHPVVVERRERTPALRRDRVAHFARPTVGNPAAHRQLQTDEAQRPFARRARMRIRPRHHRIARERAHFHHLARPRRKRASFSHHAVSIQPAHHVGRQLDPCRRVGCTALRGGDDLQRLHCTTHRGLHLVGDDGRGVECRVEECPARRSRAPPRSPTVPRCLTQSRASRAGTSRSSPHPGPHSTRRRYTSASTSHSLHVLLQPETDAESAAPGACGNRSRRPSRAPGGTRRRERAAHRSDSFPDRRTGRAARRAPRAESTSDRRIGEGVAKRTACPSGEESSGTACRQERSTTRDTSATATPPARWRTTRDGW